MLGMLKRMVVNLSFTCTVCLDWMHVNHKFYNNFAIKMATVC